MKVLLVSLSNVGGGASRLVSVLHADLNKKGIDAELLLCEGRPGTKIKLLNSSTFARWIFRIKNYVVETVFLLFENISHDYRSINIFTSRALRYINNSDAQIVHLHWIGAEMISLKQISQIRKTTIWTMHDAWPIIEGSYHIDPQDYSVVDIELKPNLLERLTYKRKLKYLSKQRIHFTSPSKWLKNKFDKSFFDKSISSCKVIPNFIDFERWYPVDKHTSREELNIKTGKRLILFGANSALKSYNKGYDFIESLMNILPKDDYAFVIFGNDTVKRDVIGGMEVFFMGKISDNLILRKLYSASDITIVPSRSESFSLVSLESIACNTPVLSFATGGLLDIVKHQVNGYLANRFDVQSLEEGIEWLCKNNLVNISDTVTHFSKEKVVAEYISLYRKLSQN